MANRKHQNTLLFNQHPIKVGSEHTFKMNQGETIEGTVEKVRTGAHHDKSLQVLGYQVNGEYMRLGDIQSIDGRPIGNLIHNRTRNRSRSRSQNRKTRRYNSQSRK
jgi:hypothetical protein